LQTSGYSIRDEYKYPEPEDASVGCYIQNRLLSQIEWYDRKSTGSQKNYKTISILAAALNGLIPVIILLADYGLAVRLLVAAVSSATAVLASIQIINNYKELWIQYRTNCSLLKSALHRFYTCSGEFANKNEGERFLVLTELCEAYLVTEFTQWNAAQSAESKPPAGSY